MAPSYKYVRCPDCAEQQSTQVGFTWWGGYLGPKLFTHVKCSACGKHYNGKTGKSNDTAIAIYVGVSVVIGIGLAIVGIMVQSK